MTQVAVLGSGLMGRGIAHVAAFSGFEVKLFDVRVEALEQAKKDIIKNLEKGMEKGKVTANDRDACLKRLALETNLKGAVSQADLIIEAVPEALALKKSLFQEIDCHVEKKPIFASNTSSLSIASIAESVRRPSDFVGMHFFNPPHLMTLLEIVVTDQTSQTTLARVKEIGLQMKRDMIVVKDRPGFATSRLGVLIGLEAIRMLEEGVASAEDIDRAMELGYKHPMGPLRLTDLVGLDTRLGIAEYLAKEIGPRFEPPRLLREMVLQGKLGKKSGEGFYRYSP